MLLKHRCTLQEMTQPLLGQSFLPRLMLSHREATNNKVYQLSGAHNAPLLYHNFWGWRCVNRQRKYQFHGQPPAGITSQCPDIFQTMQPRRIKWSRQQIAVERFSITSTRLWRNRRTSRCDIFFLFLISFLLYAVPEMFLFLYPVSSNFSSLFFFAALPQFISLCLFCSLNHSFLFRSIYLPSLPCLLLALRGLSEKIGSLVPKADGQPNDPGVKGELSRQTFFVSWSSIPFTWTYSVGRKTVKLAPWANSTCFHVLNLSPNQSLDLTKRTMVHEGPLSWKMNKEKTIGLWSARLRHLRFLMKRLTSELN